MAEKGRSVSTAAISSSARHKRPAEQAGSKGDEEKHWRAAAVAQQRTSNRNHANSSTDHQLDQDRIERHHWGRVSAATLRWLCKSCACRCGHAGRLVKARLCGAELVARKPKHRSRLARCTDVSKALRISSPAKRTTAPSKARCVEESTKKQRMARRGSRAFIPLPPFRRRASALHRRQRLDIGRGGSRSRRGPAGRAATYSDQLHVAATESAPGYRGLQQIKRCRVRPGAPSLLVILRDPASPVCSGARQNAARLMPPRMLRGLWIGAVAGR